MEIKYINLFPTIIGGGILPKEITLYNKEWINYILTNPLNKFNTWNDSLTKNERLLDENIFLPLKEYIIHKCYEYATSSNIKYENLQIASSWGVVVSPPNAPNNLHHHSNSLISGVYYLTKGSPILFYEPLILGKSFESETTTEPYGIEPEEGLLIFFPSYLRHKIMPYDKSTPRISIAFNIIPKGEFGPSKAKIWI